MKTNVDTYVDARLQQWAEWYSKHNDFGIGYRKQTNEYLIMRDKGTYIKSTTQHTLPVNKEAEEIERLVMEIAGYSSTHTKMVEALRINYFNVGTIAEKSRMLNISETCYKNWINLVKHWLLGRLIH